MSRSYDEDGEDHEVVGQERVGAELRVSEDVVWRLREVVVVLVDVDPASLQCYRRVHLDFDLLREVEVHVFLLSWLYLQRVLAPDVHLALLVDAQDDVRHSTFPVSREVLGFYSAKFTPEVEDLYLVFVVQAEVLQR